MRRTRRKKRSVESRLSIEDRDAKVLGEKVETSMRGKSGAFEMVSELAGRLRASPNYDS